MQYSQTLTYTNKRKTSVVGCHNRNSPSPSPPTASLSITNSVTLCSDTVFPEDTATPTPVVSADGVDGSDDTTASPAGSTDRGGLFTMSPAATPAPATSAPTEVTICSSVSIAIENAEEFDGIYTMVSKLAGWLRLVSWKSECVSNNVSPLLYTSSRTSEYCTAACMYQPSMPDFFFLTSRRSSCFYY